MSSKAKGTKRKAEEEPPVKLEEENRENKAKDGDAEEEEEEEEEDEDEEEVAALVQVPKPKPKIKPEIKAEVKPKAKRVKKDKGAVIKVGSLVKADFVLPDKVKNVPNPMKGLHFATAGVLITQETKRHTFYLGEDDLEKILKDRGATLGKPSKKTEVFIEGSLERMNGDDGVDKWSGSGKQLALYKRLTGYEQPIVVSFDQFMDQFGIERDCFKNSRVSRFEEGRKYKEPGPARNRGALFGNCLQWTSGLKSGQPCRPKDDQYQYPFVPRFAARAAGPAPAPDDDDDEDDGFGDCG